MLMSELVHALKVKYVNSDSFDLLQYFVMLLCIYF